MVLVNPYKNSHSGRNSFKNSESVINQTIDTCEEVEDEDNYVIYTSSCLRPILSAYNSEINMDDLNMDSTCNLKDNFLNQSKQKSMPNESPDRRVILSRYLSQNDSPIC